MEETSDKPFYLQPPWNILFDLEILGKVSPWEVNLSFLLSSFLEEMERRAEIDFRASGVALGSSATIYLMKSRLLLELEAPPSVPEPSLDFIPPPLILPLRYELTTTTIKNLLEALDEALRTEKLLALKAPIRDVLPPPLEMIPSLSVYLMEMEEEMERLLRKTRSLAEEGKAVAFSRIIRGLDRLNQIRTFIILLFLAHRNRLALWQEENSDEILITFSGG